MAVTGKTSGDSPPTGSRATATRELTALRAELKRVREALRVSRKEYEYVLQHSGHGVRIINSDFSVRFINEVFADISGVSSGAAIGKRCWEVFSSAFCHTPDCRLKRIMAGEQLVQAEIERIKPDGTLVPCLVSAVPFRDESLKVRGVIETFTDITEVRRLQEKVSLSEDRYRSFFENAPIAMWEMDYSGFKSYATELRARGVTDLEDYFAAHPDRLAYGFGLVKPIALNKRAIAQSNASSAGELVSRVNEAVLTRPGALNIFLKHTLELVNGATSLWYEDSGRTPQGELRFSHVQVSVAPGCEDTLARVFFSFTDITERKLAEDELQHYKAHLEDMVEERTVALAREVQWHSQAENKLGELYETEKKLRCQLQAAFEQRLEFTRTLVHELKTPLTPLMVSSEYLVEHLTEEPLLSFARNVQAGAGNLARRIGELLDMAQGDVGILKLKRRRINAISLVQNVYNYMLPEAHKSQISLELQHPERLPAIMADPERLQQVLFNLLNNAFKFTRKGGRVSLRVRLADELLVFEVEDTGCGIDPREKRRLFKSPSRLMRRRHNPGGMGLGLALSRLLVELHGGRIWARSVAGQGSLFSFTIPRSSRNGKTSRAVRRS